LSSELVLWHDNADATIRFYDSPRPLPLLVAREHDLGGRCFDEEERDIDGEEVPDDEHVLWVEFPLLSEEEKVE
jgi:hypothetical protein